MTISELFIPSQDIKIPSIAWGTDLHFDVAPEDIYQGFIDSLIDSKADLLLISGDISEKLDFRTRLQNIYRRFQKPIYFVLGNHDFYHSSVIKGRKAAHELMQQNSGIHYLTKGDCFEIASNVGVIGHDGWGDGRCGDFLESKLVIKDYQHIEELQNLELLERLAKVNAWGELASEEVLSKLTKALKKYQKVILVTHYPPFREACQDEDERDGDAFFPHAVCQAMGDILWHTMQKHPDRELMVLCGHAHAQSDVNILPNLRIVTGKATLGKPTFQMINDE